MPRHHIRHQCRRGAVSRVFLRHVTSYVSEDRSASYHETNAAIIADLNCARLIESDSTDTAVSISVMQELSEPEVVADEMVRIPRPVGYSVLQVPW